MSDTAPNGGDALIPVSDIPVVILAGGMGMRLREETERVPKPMVRIGEKPILWHIMSHYATHGYRRFMICLGYKSWVVKEFFLNFAEEVNDLRIDLATHDVSLLGAQQVEDWEVTLVETGLESGSNGRLQGLRRHLDTPYFMYTYGDGVSNLDLAALRAQHLASGRPVTVSGVKTASRYGVLVHDGDRVTAFEEKAELAEGYISGGFFVMQTELLQQIAPLDPGGWFEADLLPVMSAAGHVGMYAHDGFWHPMDTYRDFTHLNELWASGAAPWKTWIH